MALTMDPEYFRAIEPFLPVMASAPKLEAHDVNGRRERALGLFGSIFAQLPSPPDISATWHTIKSYDGADIPLLQASPTSSRSGGPTPAIIHAHGGGMIIGDLKVFEKTVILTASISGAQVFSVDYRVAPEHPHPTLINDVYAGLQWLHAHAKEFNVDPARIAIMGESAGGGLAAGVALKARDEKLSPPLAKQILIYPMLDDRNLTPNPALEPVAAWTNDDNITGWTALLGADKAGKEHSEYYAAPARVPDVSGLPSTYIDVGQLDVFADEDAEYAHRLIKAGVQTEFHLYPGVPHAFEFLGSKIGVTKRAQENRRVAMTSF